jgi:penicillin-binding protein 1A
VWSPGNYKNEFLGAVTLKTALAKSLNTVAAQLLAQIGVDNTIEWMRTLGMTSAIPRSMSICLGAIDVSPMEVAYAQSTFVNGGMEVPQIFVLKVLDADGEVLEDHSRPPPPRRKISAETAYLTVDLMKGVVQFGTGKKAQDLGRPAGGKTGTSQSFRDNWYVGFTKDLFAIVWVGRDNFLPIGPNSTGGGTALPFWLDYMRAAHPPTPVEDFDVPPGILFVRASPSTGKPASPSDASSVLAPFKRGTLPGQFASAKKKGDSTLTNDTQF